MFRRLLGRMGWSNYIPGSNDMGFDNRNTDAPDAPMGEAHITYLGGAKTPYSPEEAAQQERGEDVEADLVWPGKPTTMGLRNEESQAYRYNLTITNLPAGHYVLLPPTGGIRQPEGGVLLQPGEEAVFEVRFPPIAREQMPPQSFHFVLTRFDPRRRNDPGVVVGEDAARWVPLPSSADFALRADTGELRLRPWRRIAKFMLSLEDRSFLPSDANLHILRAPTKQALTEHAEQVETISQPLPARTSGSWRCELPPTQLRTSCWVMVRGAVRAGEHQTVPIALPKPIYVRYVPWLRMGRDWLFLGSVAFLLGYIGWGIPLYKSPVVYLTLDLPKGLPNDCSLQDLNVTLIPSSSHEKHVEGKPVGKEFEFHLPGHWYGWHWPFGWNRWGREDLRFSAVVGVPDKELLPKVKKIYRLDEKLKAEDKRDEFSVTASKRPVWGGWEILRTAKVRLQKQEPTIDSFTPSEVQPGHMFTINGQGFGKEPGTVLFNNALVRGVVQHWTDSAIEVKAPVGAPLGLIPVQLLLNDKDTRSEAVSLTIAKPPEAPTTVVPGTLPPANIPPAARPASGFTAPASPPVNSGATSHSVTKGKNKPTSPGGDQPPLSAKDESQLAGKQSGANIAQPSTTAKPGGTPMLDAVQSPLASSHSPAMPQTKLPSTPDPNIAPPSTSLSKQPVSKGVVTTPAPEVKSSSGTQKIVVQSNAKKLTLQGDNLGRNGEAWLSGADGRTRLRVQKWKSNMVEVDMPHHSASGMAALELTGSNHTVLADYTLYQVPKDLHSKYEERNRGGERSEKEIVSRLHQSVSALRDYQKYAAKQFWSPAYNALKNAEAQYVFILQTGHTAEDAVNAHYNLALIAQDMYNLPPNLTPADDATQCLKQARQEAWIAAQENSQSPTPLTDDIFRLINRLERATE